MEIFHAFPVLFALEWSLYTFHAHSGLVGDLNASHCATSPFQTIRFESRTCPDTGRQAADAGMEKGRGKAGVGEGGGGAEGGGDGG